MLYYVYECSCKSRKCSLYYFNRDSVLVMSEQYVKGELNGLTKTYYYEGEIYEVKRWANNVAVSKI